MMPAMEQIFTIWPTLADMSKALRVPYPTVAAWKQRGSIPAKHDLDLIEAAAAQGRQLTLAELASARRDRAISRQGAA